MPDGLAARYGAKNLRLRRFGGDAAHLAIDFDTTAVPELVGELLAACTESPDGAPLDPQFYWDLGVGKRIECLLVLEGLGHGGALAVPLDCPSCRECIQVNFTVHELLQAGNSHEAVHVRIAKQRFILRKPTGADQREWLHGTYPDARAAIRAMVRRLMVEGPEEPTEAELHAIEAALDEADPLVRCQVSARCPACHAAASHEVDLTPLTLRMLCAAQSQLVESVHRLASRYNWSEEEICALPSWRRARYLSLVEREELLR